MLVVERVILIFFQVLIVLIVVSSFLSFIVPPWNPIRKFTDRIIEPLLTPIRRLVKPVGGLDLSPLILLMLIYILRTIILSFLR